MRRTTWKAIAVAAVVALGACDTGPKGPGTLSVSVSGGTLGAVVLEASGSGIQGFVGTGGTKVYSAPVGPVTGSPTELVYRVIVVSPVGGDLHFGIKVLDVGATEPALSVIDAVDGQNRTMSGAGLQIRVSR
jgi:hypothetical protein